MAPNGWEVIFTVNQARADRNRDRNGQPIPVLDDPSLRFPIILRESLIGRRSDSQQVYPEIELHGPVISRPHAMLRLEADGNLTYLHLSPKSGSVVDGVKLAAGQSVPLRVGSVIQIGAYSDLTVGTR